MSGAIGVVSPLVVAWSRSVAVGPPVSKGATGPPPSAAIAGA
jgi:hypothetical protein